MLVFYLLLFLTLWKNFDCFDCIYTENQMEFSFDNYSYENFENEINKYPSYDYKNDNIHMCRAEIFVSYHERVVTISFADSFGWSQLDDGEARLDFLMEYNETTMQPQYYNVLEYACFDDNECDKTFVLKHIDWLLNVNYSILETQLRNFIFKNSSQTTFTEKCFTDRTTSKHCADGVCMGRYSTYYHNYYFECVRDFDTSVGVLITTTMIMESTIEKNQMIRYTCKFNQCNSQQSTDLLMNTLNNYYPLTEMEEAFSPIFSITSHSRLSTPIQISSTDLTTTTTTTITINNNKGLQINSINKYLIILINLIFYFI